MYWNISNKGVSSLGRRAAAEFLHRSLQSCMLIPYPWLFIWTQGADPTSFLCGIPADLEPLPCLAALQALQSPKPHTAAVTPCATTPPPGTVSKPGREVILSHAMKRGSRQMQWRTGRSPRGPLISQHQLMEARLLPSAQDVLCRAGAASCAGAGTHSRVTAVLSTQLGRRSHAQGSALPGSFGPRHDFIPHPQSKPAERRPSPEPWQCFNELYAICPKTTTRNSRWHLPNWVAQVAWVLPPRMAMGAGGSGASRAGGEPQERPAAQGSGCAAGRGTRLTQWGAAP